MTAWDSLAARRTGIPVFAPGHVWLAGAGPGDPGLLTLDALAGLTQADVVIHDALVDQRVLALTGAQARLEFAGKRGGKPSAVQADISERLIALARAGNRVLFIENTGVRSPGQAVAALTSWQNSQTPVMQYLQRLAQATLWDMVSAFAPNIPPTNFMEIGRAHV